VLKQQHEQRDLASQLPKKRNNTRSTKQQRNTKSCFASQGSQILSFFSLVLVCLLNFTSTHRFLSAYRTLSTLPKFAAAHHVRAFAFSFPFPFSLPPSKPSLQYNFTHPQTPPYSSFFPPSSFSRSSSQCFKLYVSTILLNFAYSSSLISCNDPSFATFVVSHKSKFPFSLHLGSR